MILLKWLLLKYGSLFFVALGLAIGYYEKPTIEKPKTVS